MSIGQVSGTMNDTGKVLVIGLDGADWEVIRPLMERGEMPNLKELVENGKYGNLTTTLPIESPVAWTSMTTGTAPGRHGIYGFLEREGDSFVPTTSEDVRKKRVWDYAGEKGGVVVMNVPQTFPPQKVNGSLISGYLSIKESGYTYPENLQQELEDNGYGIEALSEGFEPGKEEEFLEKLNNTVEERTESAETLLNRTDWKLGFVVYTGLDRLQHYFWKYRDSGEYQGSIDNHYRKLDNQIGRLLEQADENTTVMIVSDHGFGSLEKNVYLNTWLRKNGYLELEREKYNSGLIADLGLTQQNVVDTLSSFGLLKPVKNLFSIFGFNPGGSLPDPRMSDIDLDSSEAYAGNYGGKIYLTENVENREQVLEKLETELKNIEDSDTSNKIFGEIYRSEEIYTGGGEGTPDLVLKPKGAYRAVGFLGHKKVVKKPPKKSGTHRKEGIYVISGLEGKEDADIVDMAPTVLHLLGINNEDMDGKSLLR